eukprot:417182_1
MEHLKKIGAGFLDSMGTNRNKPPADDLMVSCKKQLTDLRDEINIVKTQFSQYAHQVVEAAEASVTLSKSVDKFYSKANHPGRSESVNMYKKVQEEIANRAVNTFHITVENGLISELSEWVQLTDNLHEKISAAESTRITAYDTQNRLQTLQTEYNDKKSSKKGIFGGGNRESDLEDLQQKISESSEAQKSLSLEYQNQRNNIAQQVKQLMEKRYRYFDRIYGMIVGFELQLLNSGSDTAKHWPQLSNSILEFAIPSQPTHELKLGSDTAKHWPQLSNSILEFAIPSQPTQVSLGSSGNKHCEHKFLQIH